MKTSSRVDEKRLESRESERLREAERMRNRNGIWK